MTIPDRETRRFPNPLSVDIYLGTTQPRCLLEAQQRVFNPYSVANPSGKPHQLATLAIGRAATELAVLQIPLIRGGALSTPGQSNWPQTLIGQFGHTKDGTLKVPIP